MSPFCECSIVLLVAHWMFWIALIFYWFTPSPEEIHYNKWIWLKILFSRNDWEIWIEKGEQFEGMQGENIAYFYS